MSYLNGEAKMPIYDGVVTLADDDVPVIVEVSADLVRLSASGTEIGEWATDECEIRHISDSTYVIEAENETLSFVPNQPSLFASAVNGGLTEGLPPATATPREESDPDPIERDVRTPATERRKSEAPAPKPLTMALFYALCLLTAGLALWSLVSMII